MRYLGVYITSANVFSCSLSYSKQGVYRTFITIFGKIGRIASNVVVKLFEKKCLLLYGTETRQVKTLHINLLQFVNSCFSKIFNTRSKEDRPKRLMRYCQHHFSCEPIFELISRRTRNVFV